MKAQATTETRQQSFWVINNDYTTVTYWRGQTPCETVSDIRRQNIAINPERFDRIMDAYNNHPNRLDILGHINRPLLSRLVSEIK